MRWRHPTILLKWQNSLTYNSTEVHNSIGANSQTKTTEIKNWEECVSAALSGLCVQLLSSHNSCTIYWQCVSPICKTKALAKRTRKSTQVLDLLSTCVSFGQPLALTCIDLRRRAWTWVDFGRAQIWTEVDASFSPFGHPAQVDTSWS